MPARPSDALDAALAGDAAGALGESASAGVRAASATRALDKSYHWRGVAYPAGDAVAVPADFPSQEQVDAWRHAPSPFDLDSVFPPPAPVAADAEAAPFVSAAGQPIAAELVAETWPEKAAREAARQAEGDMGGETLRTAAAAQEQAEREGATPADGSPPEVG